LDLATRLFRFESSIWRKEIENIHRKTCDWWLRARNIFDETMGKYRYEEW
jgi:hypothetical protein